MPEPTGLQAALLLMGQALALLDKAGETLVAAHLQRAIDAANFPRS
jgi:hypothetical protein